MLVVSAGGKWMSGGEESHLAHHGHVGRTRSVSQKKAKSAQNAQNAQKAQTINRLIRHLNPPGSLLAAEGLSRTSVALGAVAYFVSDAIILISLDATGWVPTCEGARKLGWEFLASRVLER
jgi:hypothetical protein